MKYPRAMPSDLGAGLARGMRGVSTSRADTGLAVGSVPTGPRVAKLDRAWRWAAATQWPARRVVGCGGVAFGCTSWPAFCLAAGASLPQCSLAGEGVRRWPPAPIPLAGAVRLVTRYQRRWVSPPAYRQTCPGCAPLWLHAGGFVN